MGRVKLLSPVLLAGVLVLALMCTSCFSSTGSSSGTTTTVIMPSPSVVKVVATTSGSQSAYYAVLDIKVKNSGAEGTILVQANVTQNGSTGTNEMPVYLKQNETHELRMTFPLVWEGGAFTTDVKAIIP
jgi:hypothetical protein